jgi:hypothetical protein
VMAWGRCSACDRKYAACICRSVQRRHVREAKRAPKAQQYVATRTNRARQWCSCGCLIRDGKCVSATCGKTAAS